jgi:hypothetical protein
VVLFIEAMADKGGAVLRALLVIMGMGGAVCVGAVCLVLAG